MRTSGLIYRIAILACITGGLAGCVKSNSSSGSSSTTGATFLTLMNLASSSADIYFNGAKASTAAIIPGFYDSRYEQIAPGAYDIQFRVTGTDSVLGEAPSSTYDTLAFNTVILYNTILPGGTTTTSSVVKIADDFSTLSTTAASYRFFNMCPDAPSVDVYFNTTAQQINRTPADNVSNTAYDIFQPVTAALYTIQIRKAGTDSIITSLNGVNLAAGTGSTIFLSGRASTPANPIALNVLVASY